MSKRTEALLDMAVCGNSKQLEIPEELTTNRRIVKPLTSGHANYIEAIDKSIITLCTGVAGTGKTYIAIAKATEMLLAGIVNKIVVTRPVVECGENLGFLPGELKDKFAPYMRPVVDVFMDFLHAKEFNKFIEDETIEFCPLAYMRGRTLRKTMVILDEGQNATLEQWRMFLTRIGTDSRIIATGDMTQKDLDPRKVFGFKYVIDRLETPPYIDGIQVVHLEKSDIVRHSIIQQIVEKIGEA